MKTATNGKPKKVRTQPTAARAASTPAFVPSILEDWPLSDKLCRTTVLLWIEESNLVNARYAGAGWIEINSVVKPLEVY